jgi:membrane protein DedA with SNARE-associated domain
MLEFLTSHGQLLGYFILLLGAFVEGESVILTISFLAYQGYFDIRIVMVIAFLGTLCADQLSFFVGRIYGPTILERRPLLRKKSEKVFELLHKYHTSYILIFRFIYGVRNISPFVIGTAGIPVKRFVILNFIAALIWTVISCTAGYLLGYFFADDIEYIIQQAIHYQGLAVGLVLGVIALGAGGVWWYRKTHPPKTED